MTATLTALVVSDVHVSLSNVHDLTDWLVEHKKNRLDCVLLAGDLTNLSNDDMLKPECRSAAEGEMSTVINNLENIHPRVIYIPGNHDCPSTFNEQPPSLTPLSQNVHKCLVEIAPNLIVAGFGGSVNGYYADNGETKWIGYPFTGESEMEQQLQVFRQHLQKHIPLPSSCSSSSSQNSIPKSVILMSHCGPSGVDTTRMQSTISDRVVLGGSSAMRGLLSDPYIQNTVILNIHGHTHAGVGISNLGRIVVLNPGALVQRNAAIVTLHYSEVTQRWAVESMELISLPLL